MTIQLSGKGVNTNAESIQTLEFTCPVNQLTEKQISIKNISNETWIIKPNISPEQGAEKSFKIEDTIVIEA